MRLDREGYPFTAVAVIAALAVYFFAGGYWSIPFWLFAVFVLQFFRDPTRDVPADDNLVVSPADGKVVAVGEAIDPISGNSATRIAIFLNVFSVHSNRIPVAGTIIKKEYRTGKFLNAAVDKSAEENERNSIVICGSDSHEITCIQIAGLIARRILCYVDTGDQVQKGQKYGFIRFGSRVELFLPPEYQVNVSIGDSVRGGADVIGSRP